jgi:hypothetical protein
MRGTVALTLQGPSPVPLLDDLLARIAGMAPDDRAALAGEFGAAIARQDWVPNPGPQTDAYLSSADVLFYGGQGGGGKSALLLGLALTQHRRSLVMRRQYTDLGALTDEAIRFHGTREGFNGSSPPKLRTQDGRLVEFGAAKNLGDEQSWQGQPHDFLGFDEAVQFHELQVRFLMGWVRTSASGQRCRTVLASNPPISAEGQWIVGMFRPWLDPTHPKPARPGELRWYVTDPDGKDREVEGPAPVELGRGLLLPQSRSFIPAALVDNPFLARTGYQAQLDALPEPIRSAVRDGNFMASRQDDAWQVIPTSWVREAQARWSPRPPPGVPMCAIGVDVAQGGADDSVLAARHDGWFAPLVAVPGKATPYGRDIAGLIVANRRDDATVIVDCGGGYGGAAVEHLRSNDPDFPVVAYKGAERSRRRTRDNKLAFVNKRSEAIWRLREALDPSQPGSSPIALPDDPLLVADVTAPLFEVGPNGIKVEAKEDVVKRLGRSTDRGDAVVMAWFAGSRDVLDEVGTLAASGEMGETRRWKMGGRRVPEVVSGRRAAHRLLRR